MAKLRKDKVEAYKIPLNKIYSELHSSPNGLTPSEVHDRLKSDGKNEIRKVRKRPIIFDFIEQFTNLFALILIFAGFLSLLLRDAQTAIVLFLIVVVNAMIGFFQEYKAERTIEALQKIIPRETVVRRSGKDTKIDVSEIVPGDLLIIQAGDTVPADLRLTKAYNLKTNDFVLTGESASQEKFAGDLPRDKNRRLTDIDNCLYTGIEVTEGFAEGIVFATGMNTEFGKIAHLTSSVKTEKSPLQKEIDNLAKKVTKLISVILPVMFAIFYITNKAGFNIANAFQFSIGVASALVPEGLVATVSIALAIGVQRIAKKQAVIRKLSSVETLGASSVIVTDKTGTLTKNEMTVKEIFVSGRQIHVSGVGYSGKGDYLSIEKKDSVFNIQRNEDFFYGMVLCNDAEIDFNEKGEATKSIGDQMEVALLVAARKAGFDKDDVLKKFPKIYEAAFDSSRRMMSVVVDCGQGGAVYTKGSPLDVLARCTRIFDSGKERTLSQKDIDSIKTKNDEFAGQAMRVLAIARKNIEVREKYQAREVENNLVFLGLAAIIDPPRKSVQGAIKECRQAGIKVFMVTGDYGVTAAAIGKRIGLAADPRVVTGDDLKQMDDFVLGKILNFGEAGSDGIIFARTTPEDKMRIVRVLKSYGYIVAVTGDGVNDAPALKSAHIGVAMGITGTEVSKEASEMVLLDDDFSDIVAAVKEGRGVYENIKKVIFYNFSGNAAEFFTVLFGSLLGVIPIYAVQILLIDLCADILPSFALALDGIEKGIMKKPPRNAKGKLMEFKDFRMISRTGIIIGALCVLVFLVVMLRGGWRIGQAIFENRLYFQATGAAYATLAVCQIFNAIESRSLELGFSKLVLGNKKLLGAIGVSIFLFLNIIYNPWLEPYVKTAPIQLFNWIFIILAGFIFLFSIELKKWKIRSDKEHSVIEALRKELFDQPV